MLKGKLFRIIPLCFFICLMCCNDSAQTKTPTKTQGEFSFWVVGNSGIKERFGTNIYRTLDSLRENTGKLDEFLYTIAEEPLTAEQIMERSGLTESEVELFLDKLEACRVVKKYTKDRWATILPVITDEQMIIIRKDLAAMADNVAQYFKNNINRIKELYENAKSPLDPSWESVSHLIIDKFIIDGSFHGNFNKLKRESDGSSVKYIPAFFLQEGEHFVNFGCNWYKFNEGDNQREVYVLHGGVLDRLHIRMNKYRRNQDFGAALLNISPDGDIQELTQHEKEMLKDLEWISGDSLLVPVIKASTLESLLPAFQEIGKEAAGIAFERYGNLSDSYKQSTYSKFLSYDEDYIQVLIHSLFGLTIEQLVKNGTVAQIPKPVPESFGAFIVSGKLY